MLELTQEVWGTNRVIYFDNYFTTISLLEKLKIEQTLACGTIRNNRKRLPNKSQLKADKELARGDSEFRVSNQNIIFVKWMDNKAVTMVSNFHGTEISEVSRKIGMEQGGKSHALRA